MGKTIDFNDAKSEFAKKENEKTIVSFLEHIKEREADPIYQAVVEHRKNMLIAEMKKYYDIDADMINAYIEWGFEAKDEDDVLIVQLQLDDFSVTIREIAEQLEDILGEMDLMPDIHNRNDLIKMLSEERKECGEGLSITEWEEDYPKHYYSKYGLIVNNE